MSNKNMKEWYFISYAYKFGFGNHEIDVAAIDSIKDLLAIARRIEKDMSIENVVVLNFILLRTEKL